MAKVALNVEELTSREAIARSFPLMKQLRERIQEATYVDEVERQRKDGYRLFAGSLNGNLVALAGIRHSHTLSRGEHVFVDDLVVSETQRTSGIGAAMMGWLADWTVQQGAPMVFLDSRDTAKDFYKKLGFKMLSSIPCMATPETVKSRSAR
jgi:N-acetylglutamate synthase-like GNAT family acetyltransferase